MASPASATRDRRLSNRLRELIEVRTAANARFFSEEAEGIARLCHRMAERFARGGRLVAFGLSPQARSDARHVAVEFVHPVIVGKRALPAIGLAREGGALPFQVDLVVRPEDIALAFGTEEEAGREEALEALARARERGCLTVAFSSCGAEWEFEPPTDDPFVRQELVETLYHVLWELVHVFFEHRGLLEGRKGGRAHDVGGSRFLYPFLGEEEHDLEAVVEDVRRSVLMKADDVAELRARTLEGSGEELLAAAVALRGAFDAGSQLLAFGNGGSATDAMDVVADFRAAPRGSRAAPAGSRAAPAGSRAAPAGSRTAPSRMAPGEWPPRPALDLTEDPAILTAIANDVGTEAVFARQIIAYGGEGDVALGISTSGDSRNVIRALEEARRRDLVTVALVGYEGGRVLSERLADHVVVSPSEHIPRIQEAQASVYHILRELVELVGEEGE